MNINKALDKAYEGKPLKELVEAPIAALEGVSDRQAELLYEAFKVKTIGQLADLRFVTWAKAIRDLAQTEE